MAKLTLFVRNPSTKMSSQVKKNNSTLKIPKLFMPHHSSKKMSQPEVEAEPRINGEAEGDGMDSDSGGGEKQVDPDGGIGQMVDDGIAHTTNPLHGMDGTEMMKEEDTSTLFSVGKGKKHGRSDNKLSEDGNSTTSHHDATETKSGEDISPDTPVKNANKKRKIMLRFDTKKLYANTTSPLTSSDSKECSSLTTIEQTTSTRATSTPTFTDSKDTSFLSTIGDTAISHSITKITTPLSTSSDSKEPPSLDTIEHAASSTTEFKATTQQTTSSSSTKITIPPTPSTQATTLTSTSISASTTQPQRCPLCGGIHTSTCLSNSIRIATLRSHLSILPSIAHAARKLIASTKLPFPFTFPNLSSSSNSSSPSPSTSNSPTPSNLTSDTQPLQEAIAALAILKPLLAQLQAYDRNCNPLLLEAAMREGDMVEVERAKEKMRKARDEGGEDVGAEEAERWFVGMKGKGFVGGGGMQEGSKLG